MITFLVCLAALVISYFTYGKYLEKTCEINPANPVPSKTMYDGVDYLPLPRWKVFLIQLLNIAGLGPIFGALLGAAYGPVAFLWITLGGIFMGAMHDFISGVISLKNNGLSLNYKVFCNVILNLISLLYSFLCITFSFSFRQKSMLLLRTLMTLTKMLLFIPQKLMIGVSVASSMMKLLRRSGTKI